MKKKDKYDWRLHWKAPRRELLLFTKQLATLLGAGVGILEGLRSLEEQPNEHFRAVVEELRELISAGHYLSAAMARFPKVFSRVYLAMVKVGESTGALVLTLNRLTQWLESEEALVRRVKASLTYPIIVMTSSIVMTLILFYFVMPGFVQIFAELGTDLPLLTQILILITNCLTSPVAWSVGLIGGAAFGYRLSRYLRTDRGYLFAYTLLLQLPLLGETLLLIAVTRFSSALSTTVGAGVAFPRALRLSCMASGSPILAERAKEMIEAVAEGDSLGGYMAGQPEYYPPLLVQMIEVAEETARIEPLLKQASIFFGAEVERRLEAMAAALEPIMLLLASLGVGLVLLGVFLPLYGFLNNLGV